MCISSAVAHHEGSRVRERERQVREKDEGSRRRRARRPLQYFRFFLNTLPILMLLNQNPNFVGRMTCRKFGLSEEWPVGKMTFGNSACRKTEHEPIKGLDSAPCDRLPHRSPVLITSSAYSVATPLNSYCIQGPSLSLKGVSRFNSVLVWFVVLTIGSLLSNSARE